jgi:hypothetical protein
MEYHILKGREWKKRLVTSAIKIFKSAQLKWVFSSLITGIIKHGVLLTDNLLKIAVLWTGKTGGNLKINLHVYLRGSMNDKLGEAFEPQIWHRTTFLQMNVIRCFNDSYLVPDLYVEVSEFKDRLSDFNFKHNLEDIEVRVFMYESSEKSINQGTGV